MSLWDNGTDKRRALCLYWYCRARLGGGVIHAGANQRTLALLGWSRGSYYRNVKLMRRNGLLSVDGWGNYALLCSDKFRKLGNKHQPKHSSTIMLGADCTMKQVRSTIAAKFVERRLDQLTKRPRKREALKVTDRRKRSSKRYYAESQGNGFAQMSTRQLVKAINMSRSWVVRWKRDAGNYFEVINNREVFPFAARCKECPPYCTYIDGRGNGILVHPTAYRNRLPYHPNSREQLT